MLLGKGERSVFGHAERSGTAWKRPGVMEIGHNERRLHVCVWQRRGVAVVSWRWQSGTVRDWRLEVGAAGFAR